MVKVESLKNSSHFKIVLREKKFHTDFFSIFAAKNFTKQKSKNTLNVSFVMKKKIGSAVKRNRIKRILRNIMDEALKKISLNLNYSYLLIAKSPILDDNYNIIKQVLFNNLKKIK